jgi:hypothetical protein
MCQYWHFCTSTASKLSTERLCATILDRGTRRAVIAYVSIRQHNAAYVIPEGSTLPYSTGGYGGQ